MTRNNDTVTSLNTAQNGLFEQTDFTLIRIQLTSFSWYFDTMEIMYCEKQVTILRKTLQCCECTL